MFNLKKMPTASNKKNENVEQNETSQLLYKHSLIFEILRCSISNNTNATRFL